MSEERIYPDHIYDEVRVKVMGELLGKEFIKLFPSLNPDTYKIMTIDEANWFDGQASELAPVHDFWNLSDGIMVGSRLKQIVKTLTAQNYTWVQNTQIDLKDIKLVWAVGTLSEIGNPPYVYNDIIKYLSNAEKKRENLAMSDAFENKYSPRDHYPILLRENSAGNDYDVLDGNRRVLRAILKGQSSIKANIGYRNYNFSENYPINYWVTTGELRKLMQSVEICYKNGSMEVVESIRSYLKYLFSVSDIARINWNLRCRDNSKAIQEFSLGL